MKRIEQLSKPTMPYLEAPSGRIYTIKWEPPYVRVKKGHGFIGVLAQDVETQKMQCHKCGKWFELLATHVTQTHAISAKKYKQTYGLLESTALSIERIRIRQSNVAKRLISQGKLNKGGFKKGNSLAANRKGTHRGAEWENKYGICERQIVEKVIRLADQMGKTPSLVDLANEYGSAINAHIRHKFRSYIRLCRREGLEPLTSNYNPKYSRAYFVKKLRQHIPGTPLIHIFNTNEQRAMLRYFSGAAELRSKAYGRKLLNRKLLQNQPPNY